MDQLKTENHENITVVSGLPRSGTSMMMQMLRAGGLTCLTDELREADISNPKGYFEFEKVKGLRADNSWLPEAKGKVIKIISHPSSWNVISVRSSLLYARCLQIKVAAKRVVG